MGWVVYSKRAFTMETWAGVRKGRVADIGRRGARLQQKGRDSYYLLTIYFRPSICAMPLPVAHKPTS